jgi:hypothetical protein
VKKYSLSILILANIMPILGIIFLDWSLFSIMFFYWLESAVVGIFNIAKIMMINPVQENGNVNSESIKKTRFSVVGFFIFHYGMFMLGHVLFIFELFGPSDIKPDIVLIGLASLGISHGISFIFNFIKHKEYEKVTIKQQMFAPYRRILVMHLTIFFCGFLISIFGTHIVALVIMVIIKIVIDILSHVKEHDKLGTFVKSRIFR